MFIAGWSILFTVEGTIRWDGWAMCLSSAGALVLLNLLFRYGSNADQERGGGSCPRVLHRARRWPDEP